MGFALWLAGWPTYVLMGLLVLSMIMTIGHLIVGDGSKPERPAPIRGTPRPPGSRPRRR